jgi:hypothetical protein
LVLVPETLLLLAVAFASERGWASESHKGHKADGTPTSGEKEPVLGVIAPQDCDIGRAEKGETGIYRVRLLPDGSIDVILIASGDYPLAIRNRYTREAQ